MSSVKSMQAQSVLLLQTVRAGTDVAAGQELTICYQDVATAGLQRRQETLQRSFNFLCCCEVIMLHNRVVKSRGADNAASMAELRLIRRSHPESCSRYLQIV